MSRLLVKESLLIAFANYCLSEERKGNLVFDEQNSIGVTDADLDKFFAPGVPHEVTFGEKRVQRNFNPSANPDVEIIKDAYAGILDHLESLRNERNGREISLAQTEAETSCMYAVKSLFV